MSIILSNLALLKKQNPFGWLTCILLHFSCKCVMSYNYSKAAICKTNVNERAWHWSSNIITLIVGHFEAINQNGSSHSLSLSLSLFLSLSLSLSSPSPLLSIYLYLSLLSPTHTLFSIVRTCFN